MKLFAYTAAMKSGLRLLLALALLAGGCRGAEEPASAAPAPRAVTPNIAKPSVTLDRAEKVDDAERTAILARVAMVGASATAGFGAVVDGGDGPSSQATLSQVFAAAIRRSPPARVSNAGHIMFFNAPMDIGPGLVDSALRADPTLVVGVDFLFWYGYGRLDHNRRPISDEMSRVDLLEEGLAQLDRFECPVVVGDFPDVSPAIGLMLRANQVPTPDTLEILNARVHEWASERPNVTVLPFAELVEKMRTNERFNIGSYSWPEGSERVLVQPDRLHPTTEGLVALVQMVVQELLTRFPALKTGDFDLDPDSLIGRLRQRSRGQQKRRRDKGN